MNTERIKELAIEAGDDWEHTLKEDREFLERFAELIVRECMSVCQECVDDGCVEAEEPLRKIKEHFGVE